MQLKKGNMFTKELLIKEYLASKLSSRDIAKKYGICQRTVIVYLNKFNIKKSEKEYLKQRHKKIEHTLFKKGHKVNQEWIEAGRKANLGQARHCIPHTEETKMKISKNRIGKAVNSNNPNWKGGVTSKNRLLRSSNNWKKWRKLVFERDNYICQDCSVRSTYLHPHHIVPVSECIAIDYEDLVFDIDNGLTLCKKCHFNNNWHKGLGKFNYLIGGD